MKAISKTVVPCIALALLPLTAQAAAIAAKDYPAKVIRIVVPYGAGAGPDVVGRIIAEKLGPALGTNMVFDNRGGGGGMLGTDIVAKSPPDGYTILSGSTAGMSIAPNPIWTTWAPRSAA